MPRTALSAPDPSTDAGAEAAVVGMSQPAVPLRARLDECPDPRTLEREWLDLQAQAEASPFTRWNWIGTWWRQLPDDAQPWLMRVDDGSQTVGLGLLGQQTLRRLRMWPSRAVILHAVGRPDCDDLTIEHNGLLARRGLEEAVDVAVLSALLAGRRGVDQVVMPGMVRMPVLPPIDPPQRAPVVRTWTQPAFRVDLEPIRAAGRVYLDALGARTRSSVRRSLRLYEALGPVEMDEAADVDQALAFLARLETLHQATWQARGAPGAFANPRFGAFHRAFVAKGHPEGAVQLLRLRAGQRDIGVLYNLVGPQGVMSYQSGFDYRVLDVNHHPGLVTHALAVQRALESGHRHYDLLAGESRYKDQLATARYQIATVSVHRPSAVLMLEQAWQRWSGRRRTAHA
jgi:CelD/BcsL family acetyltransferase involved in cellulose biosynthesis